MGNRKGGAGDAVGTWTLYADGAARGNPGPAAFGWVLDDPEGNPHEDGGETLGVATNNVAEYKGLIEGMRRALEIGVQDIEVRMDSELAVRQMTGIYKVRNAGLKPLFEEARVLSRRFRRFGIAHVRREFNARADACANRALDAPARG
jgi:ribonuclease HI